MREKVIVWGKGKMFLRYIDYIKAKYDVVGEYDETNCASLDSTSFDTVIVTSKKFYEDIKDNLISKRGIEASKITLINDLVSETEIDKFIMAKISTQDTISFQEWKRIFSICLRNMNIGGGGDVETSGEEYVLRYLKQNFGENLCVFDVGANIGNYSLLIKKIMPSAVVYAFEASKETFSKLKENIQNIDGLHLENIGVSDKPGEAILYSDKKESGLASLFNRKLDVIGKTFDRQEHVELTSLDSYCADKNIEYIDFLKMDIEGNEYNALLGAKELLEQGRIGAIQIEFGGCNIDSKSFVRDYWYLLCDKYEMYRILGNEILQIERYEEMLEQFLTQNFLFIKK